MKRMLVFFALIIGAAILCYAAPPPDRLPPLLTAAPAEARTIGIFGGSVPSGADPCANLGSYSFYFDSDHTSGATIACVSGGTVTGTASGATAGSTDQNHTTGGSKSLKCPDTNTYLRFERGTLANTSEGYMSAWVYITDRTKGGSIIELYYDVNNYLAVGISSSNYKLVSSHTGNTTANTTWSTNAVSDNTWHQVQVRWSVANSQFDIKLDSDAWDTDNDVLVALATEASYIDFGEHDVGGVTTGGILYIDDVQLSSTYPGR